MLEMIRPNPCHFAGGKTKAQGDEGACSRSLSKKEPELDSGLSLSHSVLCLLAPDLYLPGVPVTTPGSWKEQSMVTTTLSFTTGK